MGGDGDGQVGARGVRMAGCAGTGSGQVRGRGWRTARAQAWVCPWPHRPVRDPPPAIPVPQIPTQRKVNIYNILQEIVRQEGELEEQCVQRLVAIASKEMRDFPEVAGPWAPGVPPLPALARARPVTSRGKSRLNPRKPSGAAAGVGQDGFFEGPGGGVTPHPSPSPSDGRLRGGRGG